jgi:hypothetical protein
MLPFRLLQSGHINLCSLPRCARHMHQIQLSQSWDETQDTWFGGFRKSPLRHGV